MQLIDILNPYLCIIFVTVENANELAQSLNESGIKVGMIHGGLTPRERKQQMKRIRNLDFQYVIASDLASRGIDIEGVSHVVNFDVLMILISLLIEWVEQDVEIIKAWL